MSALEKCKLAEAGLAVRLESALALCGMNGITVNDVDGIELALQSCKRINRGASLQDEQDSMTASAKVAAEIGDIRAEKTYNMALFTMRSCKVFA